MTGNRHGVDVAVPYRWVKQRSRGCCGEDKGGITGSGGGKFLYASFTTRAVWKATFLTLDRVKIKALVSQAHPSFCFLPLRNG